VPKDTEDCNVIRYIQ